MKLGVLERVGILLRANLSDVLARAEDPAETLRQVMVDIQNQLLQVKSRMAVALSDQVAQEGAAAESAEKAAAFMRKAAEAAKRPGGDDVAKDALRQALSHRRLADKFEEQVRLQKAQVETLRRAFLDLEHKLTEAKANGAALLARERRAASGMKAKAGDGESPTTPALAAAPAPARRDARQQEREIDQLLVEMKKARRA